MTSGDLVALGIENIQGDVLVTSSGLKKLNTKSGDQRQANAWLCLTVFFSLKLKVRRNLIGYLPFLI